MHIHPRLALASATAAALLISLAACGGDGDTSSSPAADPQQVLVDRTTDGLGDSGAVHVVSTFTNGTGEGDSAYGDSFLADMAMDIINIGNASVIAADDLTYLNIPGQTAKGKYGALTSDNPIAATLRFAIFNPEAMVDVFEAATSVEEKGSKDVGGVSTDEYEVKVASADALKAWSVDIDGVQPDLAFEVNVDEDDHIVRLVYDILDQHVEMDMSNWGEDVTIEVPSKKNIIDLGF